MLCNGVCSACVSCGCVCLLRVQELVSACHDRHSAEHFGHNAPPSPPHGENYPVPWYMPGIPAGLLYGRSRPQTTPRRRFFAPLCGGPLFGSPIAVKSPAMSSNCTDPPPRDVCTRDVRVHLRGGFLEGCYSAAGSAPQNLHLLATNTQALVLVG